MSPDILMHYGIKGMKWGVRKSRKSSGSGNKKTTSKNTAKEKRKAELQRRKNVYKNRRTLTDKQLNKEVARLQLEKQYRDLSDADMHKGRRAVSNFLKTAGGRVASTAAIGGLAYAGYLAMGGQDPTGGKLADYMFPNPNRKK